MKRRIWIILALAVLLAAVGCASSLADGTHSFVTQPTSEFDGTYRTFRISWQTSFKPVKVEIVKFDSSGSSTVVKTITDYNSLKASMYTDIDAHWDASSDYYRVYAYYGGGVVDYEPSGTFTNDWASVKFTAQPMSVFDSTNRYFRISWQTSYKPVKVEITKYNSSGSGTVVKTITDPDILKASMYTDIEAHWDASSDYYRIYAYYGSGVVDYEPSDTFTNDWASVKFTVQPMSVFDSTNRYFRISWQTSYKPVKVEITKYNSSGSGTVVKTITDPDILKASMYTDIEAHWDASSDYYRVYAYYGSGVVDYEPSDTFTNDWASVKFVNQLSGKLAANGSGFELQWKTSFRPVKVIVRKVDVSGSWHTVATLTPDTTTMKQSMSYPIPIRDANGSDTYHVMVFYGDGAADNLFSSGVQLNMNELRFTQQPVSGTVYQTGGFEETWTTSFIPVSVEIGWVSSGHYYCHKTYTTDLARRMTHTFTYEHAPASTMYVRAYYNDTQFVESLGFHVTKATDHYFTRVPLGGTLNPDESRHLEWTTSFQPGKLKVLTYSSDGQLYIIAKDFMSGSFTESASYDLPWDRAGTGSGTAVVRAWVNQYTYVDATCTINKIPLKFTTQPHGGIASPISGKLYTGWETNFTPASCVLERKAGGTWTTETSFHYSDHRHGYDIPIDLDSTEENFTFRLKAYYNGPIPFSVASNEFVIENPLPVTLTLTCPGRSTADQVYTLIKGQKASTVLRTLPTGTAAYSIDGWYTDANYITPFSLNQQIMANTVVYAKTTTHYYTVTFQTNGGSAIDPVTVAYGSTITADRPVRDEYIFVQWFRDAGLTDAFLLNYSPITGDTVLYAKWIADGVAINEENFPNSGFRNAVKNKFDLDGDNILRRSEIEAATTFSYTVTAAWTSIQGVQFLTDLTSLSVKNHGLTGVDLRRNIALTALDLSKGASLTAIDLSANTELKTVNLSETGLTAIDATMLTKAYKLDLHGCTSLTRVGVKGSAMRILDVHGTGLHSLDISACSNLWMAYLHGTATDHGTYVEYYHQTNNARLTVDKGTVIYVPQDTLEITSDRFPDEMFRAYVCDRIDLDHNGRLNPEEIAAVTEIYIAGRTYNPYWPISSLQGIAYFPELTSLTVADVGLTQADLSGNTKLVWVYLNGNDLESLDVSMLPLLRLLNVYQNPRLTVLRPGAAPELQQLWCFGTGVTALDLTECPRLALAYLYSEPSLVHLSDEYGDCLMYMWVDPHGDESRDVRLYVNPDLADVLLPDGLCVNAANFPDAEFRRFISEQIDTDGDSWLTPAELAADSLYIDDEYDIHSMEGLRYLTVLTRLEVYTQPNLTDIDLRNNTGVQTIIVNDTGLCALLLGAADDLTVLDVSGNDISFLDVRNYRLQELHISSNPLEKIYLGTQPLLQSFDSTDTLLPTVDISLCTKLNDVVINGTRTERSYGYEYTGGNYLDVWLWVSGSTEIIDTRSVAVDETNFPDEAFRALVSDNFDTNGSGWLTAEEIAAAEGLSCEEVDFTTLEGIGRFTALTSLLIDGAPSLTGVDFSANTQLVYLDVSQNGLTWIGLEGLTELRDLSVDRNSLTSLDVSELSLTNLACHTNPMTSLVLGEQPGLCRLYCQDTQLASLDLRGCPELLNILENGTRTVTDGVVEYKVDNLHRFRIDESTELILPDSIPVDAAHFPDEAFRGYVSDQADGNENGWLSASERNNMVWFSCSGKGITSLAGLEYFPKTVRLYVANNPDLTELDLGSMPKLNLVNAAGCALTSVNLTGCPDLDTVQITGNPIASIDLSGNPGLIQLDVNDCVNLQTLDLSGNPQMQYLKTYGSGIRVLNIQGCVRLVGALNGTRTEEDAYEEYTGSDCYMRVNHGTEFLDAGSVPLDEAHFPDGTFRDLIADNFDTNSTGWLTSAEIAAVKSISFEDHDFATVDGIAYFTELETLCIADADSLESIDLRANAKLTDIDLCHNGLTEIKLDGLTQVLILCVYDNNLTALDVSGLTALRDIQCDNNGLTALDLSHNTGLISVECYNNPLTSLNLGSQPGLTMLRCYGTDLTELDITGCPRLIEAYHGAKNTGSPDYDVYTAAGCSLYVDKGMRIEAGDPEPTFFLPASLTVLEDEAFSGIPAVAVVIPGSVTSIIGDPFADSSVRYIYGYTGSAAQTMAANCGYIFVHIDDDWMTSH